MKCKICPNTDKTNDFFIAIDDKGQEVVCGDCVNKMYEHFLKHTLNSQVKKPKSKSEPEIPSTKTLVEYLDQYIIRQETAKKDIAIAVRNHYKRLSLSLDEQGEIDKSNILLMGESGTGKTAIIQHIARFINVPMVVVDTTSMSASGYTGDDVENCIKELYVRADKNKALAEKGIVFLDEIDKKRKSKGGGSTADVSGEDVQKSFLRLLEGKEVKVAKNVSIDTKNILFIAGGAFVGLEKIVQQRMETNAIGFGRTKNSKDIDMADIYKNVTTDDLVEFGMIPELVGRLPIHTYTNTLTQNDIKRVMTETKNSVVKQFETLFAVDGVQLQFKPEAVDFVADKVVKDKIGVRGLRKVLEKELRNIQYDIEEYHARNIKTVVVGYDANTNRLKTTFRYNRKNKTTKNK